jgi:hypothetical protein
MRGKRVLAVAAAGGGGGGTVSCSATIERMFTHLGMPIFDIIPIRRRTKSYILPALVGAGKGLVEWEGD